MVLYMHENITARNFGDLGPSINDSAVALMLEAIAEVGSSRAGGEVDENRPVVDEALAGPRPPIGGVLEALAAWAALVARSIKARYAAMMNWPGCSFTIEESNATSSRRTRGDPSVELLSVAIATPNSMSLASSGDRPHAGPVAAIERPNFLFGSLDPVVPNNVPNAYSTDALTSGIGSLFNKLQKSSCTRVRTPRPLASSKSSQI
ncbi:BZ3500_MvSof-1268-A1-R1_Chr7-1g09331 [Microbotryum saponariae]|uniref:BZ3500_MvSof-1268-A1-R1_Chr7-1g09331 protein n=1 Tax=Microbotryum saponariae TaxID=289078 RepID=A0A2X0M2L1_9BASI|nr:BZ3501_MvSof-1269-A2-R1_Chr7-1g09036 [Microbotryum saponariae]SDA03245.1 BZ3500_MvSof-1268-A1-R1_Chr7-1g09331 [Microbotryum saponariae]